MVRNSRVFPRGTTEAGGLSRDAPDWARRRARGGPVSADVQLSNHDMADRRLGARERAVRELFAVVVLLVL